MSVRLACETGAENPSSAGFVSCILPHRLDGALEHAQSELATNTTDPIDCVVYTIEVLPEILSDNIHNTQKTL
jgi:hypothetical protein